MKTADAIDIGLNRAPNLADDFSLMLETARVSPEIQHEFKEHVALAEQQIAKLERDASLFREDRLKALAAVRAETTRKVSDTRDRLVTQHTAWLAKEEAKLTPAEPVGGDLIRTMWARVEDPLTREALWHSADEVTKDAIARSPRYPFFKPRDPSNERSQDTYSLEPLVPPALVREHLLAKNPDVASQVRGLEKRINDATYTAGTVSVLLEARLARWY